MLSETSLNAKIIERDTIKIMYRSVCKVFVIFVSFQRNLNFRGRFSKKKSNVKFNENTSSGRRTDRRTNVTKLIVASHNFCERACKLRLVLCCPFLLRGANTEDARRRTTNFALSAGKWLDNHFPGRWIGRWGQTKCPP